MKERKFKPKLKIKDDRKGTIQYKSKTHSYDSPLAKAVRQQREEARTRRIQKKYHDYKPPKHGRRKK